uniref:(northern house mosquito) hypothetical protein n=1 Tax=Culex pipiens TaxID=7175 RepID=A0A8D8IU30_CULPI
MHVQRSGRRTSSSHEVPTTCADDAPCVSSFRRPPLRPLQNRRGRLLGMLAPTPTVIPSNLATVRPLREPLLCDPLTPLERRRLHHPDPDLPAVLPQQARIHQIPRGRRLLRQPDAGAGPAERKMPPHRRVLPLLQRFRHSAARAQVLPAGNGTSAATFRVGVRRLSAAQLRRRVGADLPTGFGERSARALSGTVRSRPAAAVQRSLGG